ncbi:MAG: hypothetical protein JNM59_06870 [Hyphomonadaceae bacterium]|nr:hypothetical protein [Hyphomonadaceae bacterium]
MRKALLLLAVLAASSLAAVQPSEAQFETCNADYVRRFETPEQPGYPAWSPGEIECVEYFRFSFSTPGGMRWIRGIGDVNADTLAAPGAFSAVEDGARRAAQYMASLGNYRIENATILMAFDVSRPGELSDDPSVRAEGGAGAWTSPPGEECLVTVFMITDASARGELQYATAHELFHCIQNATLSPEQNAASYGAGLWWVEGSAEWFAAAAIGEQERWNVADAFEQAVRANRPLNDMSYEMAVFFYWLDQTRGAGAIMPFLSGMAPVATPAAQRAAMRDQLSDEGWLQFAQDYLDGEVAYPDGGQIPRPDIEGETWTISASGTHRRSPAPFVITAGRADFECGRWDTRAADVNDAVREESSRDWGAWPSEVDARERGAVRYRVVALNTRDASVEQELDARRTATCASCLSQTVIDRCLVGTWRLTAGGPLEWLRRNGLPISGRDDLVMTMNEDGTFTSRGFNMDHTITMPDMVGETRGQTQGTSGRWSAEAGALTACFDGGGEASGVSTVHTTRGSGSAPFSMGGVGGESGSTRYTCDDTTFFTSAPTPRGGPMTHTFTRQTPRRR